MTPIVRPRRARGVRSALAGLLLALPILSACGGGTAASFDPAAPCSADVRLAGAYPELEARIPGSLFGSAPTSLDSGRNCSPTNLGTLKGHGIEELRFAGGRWDRSRTSGVTLAVFAAEGLTAEWLGEWYEASARATNKTAGLRPSRPMIDGRQAYRLDLLASEVPQTVLCWASADGSLVHVVLAAGVPEADVAAGVAAFR